VRTLILLLVVFISMFLGILGLQMFKFSKLTPFSLSLAGIMMCELIWLWYVGILYVPELLEKQTIELIFRIMRIGSLSFPTMIFFNLTETLVYSQEKIGYLNKIFTRKNVFWYGGVTLLLYVLNFTPMTVEGMKLIRLGGFEHYYPVYGVLGFTQFLQTLSIVIWLSCGVYMAIKMKNKYLKAFHSRFSIIAIVGSFLGLMNFIEGAVIYTTLLSAVVFTVGIMYAFHHFREKVMEHERKLEIEKIKIEYVGYATSSLIHEIKNPLTVVSGYFQLIQQQEGLDENIKRMINITDNSAKHIQNVLDDFVKFVNTKEIKPEYQSVNAIIKQAMDMMRIKSDEKHIVLHSLEETEEITLAFDTSRISQVLINLYKNAIEAMEETKGEKNIYTKLYSSGYNMHLEIQDTGKGIPKEMIDVIFKPFKTDKEKGTGLGLSICQNIMLAHKGKIEIKESSENGTTFLLTLPIEDYSTMFIK